MVCSVDLMDIVDDAITDGPYRSSRELIEADVFRMRFNSEQKGHDFYNAYANVMGFSIQKDLLKVRNNVVCGRKWVCSRQGQGKGTIGTL